MIRDWLTTLKSIKINAHAEELFQKISVSKYPNLGGKKVSTECPIPSLISALKPLKTSDYTGHCAKMCRM